MGKDEGPEARLQGTALYTPTPGWPTGNEKYGLTVQGLEFPVKVNFRIAMTSFPEGEPAEICLIVPSIDWPAMLCSHDHSTAQH